MASSVSSTNFSDKTFAGVGNLIKLLPTGTIFLFQFASPVLTNSGAASCSAANKAMDAALIALCGLSCCFTCFTDSYTDPSDGRKRYGIVTTSGLWTVSGGGAKTSSAPPPDLSRYGLRFGDFVHAFFSLVVFATLALLDSNTVRCFYPGFAADQKLLLQVMPAVIGVFSGAVFMLFPNERHGIGYPSTIDDTTTTTADDQNQNPTGKV